MRNSYITYLSFILNQTKSRLPEKSKGIFSAFPNQYSAHNPSILLFFQWIFLSFPSHLLHHHWWDPFLWSELLKSLYTKSCSNSGLGASHGTKLNLTSSSTLNLQKTQSRPGTLQKLICSRSHQILFGLCTLPKNSILGSQLSDQIF